MEALRNYIRSFTTLFQESRDILSRCLEEVRLKTGEALIREGECGLHR